MVETGIYARVRDRLAASGLKLDDDERVGRLAAFVREVALWSGRIHLVGKRRIRWTLVQLFIDSWQMYLFARDAGILCAEDSVIERGVGGKEGPRSDSGAGTGGLRVADVGAGAGFPGILWKIVDPRLDITLFEKREKALRFLERTVARLGLEEVRVEGGDAKEFEGAGTFDIVLSKAAGRLIEMSPVVSRLLRPGGFYLTVKGEGWRDEIDGSVKRVLRLEATRELPEGRGEIVMFSRCEGPRRRG